MNKLFLLVSCAVLVFSLSGAESQPFREGKPGKKECHEPLPPPPPPHDGHGPDQRFRKGPGTDPLFGFIENSDFSAEEKKQLKELAAKDPRAARREIRRMMKERRKLWAEKVLALREQYRNAQTDADRKKAEEALRKEISSDAERRLAMNRKMLENMQRGIERMQKQLEDMRKNYNERVKGKEEFINSQLKELTGEKIPERLLRSAR